MSIIQKLIEKTPSLKIAVIGDFIEDRYIIGEVSRISPEAPVPLMSVSDFKYNPGGAGNVFMNLMELGVDTLLYTGSAIITLNTEHGGRYRLHGPGNTYCKKTRVMTKDGHHLVRYDDDYIMPNVLYSELNWRDDFEKHIRDFDCVVMADYHKGLISEDVADSITKICADHGIPVVVDAKKEFSKFFGATIVKCNEKEREAFTDDIEAFINKFEIDNFVVTYGSDGIGLYNECAYRVPGHKVPIVDVCGAGDTVTAILAVGEAMRADRKEVISLANRCAAEVCKYPGVTPISIEHLNAIENESTKSNGVSI
jgi:rfaE bifunctional protein kinase chain/domain